jgi:hypothetical protein
MLGHVSSLEIAAGFFQDFLLVLILSRKIKDDGVSDVILPLILLSCDVLRLANLCLKIFNGCKRIRGKENFFL